MMKYSLYEPLFGSGDSRQIEGADKKLDFFPRFFLNCTL